MATATTTKQAISDQGDIGVWVINTGAVNLLVECQGVTTTVTPGSEANVGTRGYWAFAKTASGTTTFTAQPKGWPLRFGYDGGTP
ncbi:MAG: hypothetical protein IPJ61_21015 [Tessaracoccus sp.]|uniref:hypothetical protein n=1 Tax=Tessaracoccus sp. TaxID=1971211 RepID=UPI001EB427DA|nr:hypothetical protein [Tessaracoccus sp.]MBK7823471.1 hypothetical protein [Tessaracoccus sp.]